MKEIITQFHTSENKELRSEEVNDIIDRMPTKFGLWITIIVGFIVCLILIFGWLVRYPDVVTGQIIISAKTSPVKLISNTPGKIKLNIQTSSKVKSEFCIAYIKSPADYDDVQYLKNIIEKFNIYAPEKTLLLLDNKKLALGELTELYFKFFNALQQDHNYKTGNVIFEQGKSLSQLHKDQIVSLGTLKDQLTFAKQNLFVQKKMFSRDSALFIQKVLTELEYEKSKINLLTTEQNYRAMLRELINSQESLNDSQSQIQQIEIQKSDKSHQLLIDYLSALNNLRENIKAWEQKYCFISPFNGTLQLLKFIKNDDYVATGEELFTIIPINSKPLGQMMMPAAGAGKVKIGQNVVIKLENYPYMEFGSILGKVKDISLISKDIKSADNSSSGVYLVQVTLPKDLTTNYGSKLNFKFELKGSAEIITSEKRLIQRFYDNIKYVLKK